MQNEIDDGRVPLEPGYSAEPEPVSAVSALAGEYPSRWRWRYDPANYRVGDPIYIQVRRGWNSADAHEYTVAKITPKGQITATRDGVSIRITARGSIVGDDSWRPRSVLSAEQAHELQAGARMDAAWHAIRDAGERIGKAAHRQDDGALQDALKALASAMSAREGQDAEERLGATPASAVPQGDATTNPRTGDQSNG